MAAKIEPDTIIQGDALAVLKTLPDQSVNCCVTSPPYWGLRDYNVKGQIGLEETPEEHVEKIVKVFREVKRVLQDDGTLWLNLGDSYADAGYSNHANTGGARREDGGKPKHLTGSGLKPKDLVGIPWRVAFALQADGWWLRSDIIWEKRNPMPESVRDRPTKSHEHIFLLAKNKKYYYDQDAIREPLEESTIAREKSGYEHAFASQFKGSPLDKRHVDGKQLTSISNSNGRNKRDVWTVSTKPYKEAHFATFPPDLIRPCILAGCPEVGIVLDPFFGAGTTGVVAKQEDRHYIGIELNPEYIELAKKRIAKEAPMDRLI